MQGDTSGNKGCRLQLQNGEEISESSDSEGDLGVNTDNSLNLSSQSTAVARRANVIFG